MSVVIIGSGIIGLLSALTLTEAGYKVTIIARDLPGDETQSWASPWAGAAIFPYPDSNGHSLQVETFRYYWALAHRDPTSGVQTIKATEYFDDRDDDSSVWYKHLVPRYHRIPTEDLPQGAKMGFTYKTMTVNPLVFLPWIKKHLETMGVKFIRREVKSIEEAQNIAGCKIVVHASGLGAYHLAGDKNVVAIRGQTMFVENKFDEVVMFQGSEYTYVIPRMYSGGVIMGGVSQEGNLEPGVDEDLRSDILQRTKNIAPSSSESVNLKDDKIKDIVAFRPGRKGGYRLEPEGNVVHAYGFGSLGYIYSYGVAMKIRDLVDSMGLVKPIVRSRL
ncbi:hypothetical protein N7478_008012 [Penicillium angulare]|uniref:uncharacterized protein n=1 Tax=Penicillium angulare TaxID=116970 RepID=UPI002540A337|nr:uncharacterized protein N7478_008012 [Penicillium angulare]KAJ5272887.1 hypothetical protein N7478_008012 [Penicillium angulare]